MKQQEPGITLKSHDLFKEEWVQHFHPTTGAWIKTTTADGRTICEPKPKEEQPEEEKQTTNPKQLNLF